MQLLNDIDFLKFTGEQESQFLIRPKELRDKIRERLSGEGILSGDCLPWSKTHPHVRLRPKEVSLWAGIAGHGKSQLLGQVAAWNLKYKNWLIASMEMPPEATMERMSKQAAGCNPSDEYLDKFLDWTNTKLWIYDQSDNIKTERILGMVYYAAKELKINHIVIDSLMKSGIKKDDYEGQTEFVNRLCWAAKATGCHIHLVHHMRKGEKESRVPGKFDVRGASEIVDQVDNLFIVHRNIDKEEKIRKNLEYDHEQPDGVLVVAKQRHGEWEGGFKLWFNQESKQYTASPDKRVMQYHV